MPVQEQEQHRSQGGDGVRSRGRTRGNKSHWVPEPQGTRVGGIRAMGNQSQGGPEPGRPEPGETRARGNQSQGGSEPGGTRATGD